MTGLFLAQYRIDAELGRGGMGIVYRATDTKLNRPVALKVLPPAALSSEDDRARFFREAQAAAQLHHPNIATVFGIDEAVPVSDDGRPVEGQSEKRPFIAMELIEGETLQEHIKKGPVRLPEAISIAMQVAEALKAAHAKNIVHRDIKGANVMLTPGGVAKVLDFGLAKTNQSTMLTRMGSTLGTVAFMSPEQARGEEVDHRTDLWALGVLMYEMIAGRLPFSADYEQAALYGILNEDPEPLTSLRTGVPMDLEAVVAKLLRKEARMRYQTAADVMADLEAVSVSVRGSGSGRSVAAMSTVRVPKSPAGRSLGQYSALPVLLGVAGLVLGSLVTSVFLRGEGETGSPGTPKLFSEAVPVRGGVLEVAISPDGTKVAYVSGVVHVLDLSTGVVTPYNDLGDAVTVEFSADGNEMLIARSTGVVRVPVAGGVPLSVVPTTEGGPRASWGPDGTVFYEDQNAIFQASISGGVPRQAAFRDSTLGETDMDWPTVLPGGKVLVATIESTGLDAKIGFFDVETAERLAVLPIPGYRVRWLETGHLVFAMNDAAVAMPFDMARLEQTGPIIPIASGVRSEGLSISDEGTLVHGGMIIGYATVTTAIQPILVEVDAQKVRRMSLPIDEYLDVRLHPDGARAVAAIGVGNPPYADIWILDLDRSLRTRLTEGGINRSPSWLPDGETVLYAHSPLDGEDLNPVRQKLDGSGRTVLRKSLREPGMFDLDASRDGTLMAYVGAVPSLEDQVSTLYVDRTDDGTPLADFRGRFQNPRRPAFSPDGRYLAFEERGAIRILSLERPDAVPQTVWEQGMSSPRWTADGRTLFAQSADGNPQFIRVTLDPAFNTLSLGQQAANWPVAGSSVFDVSADGRFVILPTTPDGTIDPAVGDSTIDLHFIVNLYGLLEAQARR